MSILKDEGILRNMNKNSEKSNGQGMCDSKVLSETDVKPISIGSNTNMQCEIETNLKSEFIENNPDILKSKLSSCEELTEEDYEEEDYDTIRRNNIKEKEKMLAIFFEGVNVADFKRSPSTKAKRKYVKSVNRPAVKFDLPRRHLPRRKASQAASNRLVVDSDDDEAVNLSDGDVSPSSKRRKVVIARRPVPREGTPRGPRVILQPEDISKQDLQRVADIVTEKKYSQSGSTCHQCRQKTDDMKTICRSSSCSGIRGLFCGPCLRNRYGEDAREALKDPAWSCPPCRGICNCSICRNRAGASATGILTPLAKKFGYNSVKEYLTDHDTFIIKYEDN